MRSGRCWTVRTSSSAHTPYAVEAAAAVIRTSGYPGADQIAGWLLEPEDPDEVSAYFESIAT